MPCHVGDNHDRGGNHTQVRFFDRGMNMHSLWDGGMIERVSKDEDYWLTDLAALDTPAGRQEAIRGTVEDWGDRIPAGRQGSLREPHYGHADEARREAGA